jgi:YfiH family protein
VIVGGPVADRGAADGSVYALEWEVPAGVRAACTTRRGGVSRGAYASFNLATHVGDDPDAVRANRAQLQHLLALPAAPCWLEQVHGTTLVHADPAALAPPRADAAYTRISGRVCAVLTADCLPILLCDHRASVVAAVHAGWRGLLDGILPRTVAALAAHARDWLAWIGPGIGVDSYAVGPELRARFVAVDAGNAAFFTRRDGAWLADLAGIAERQLHAAGLAAITRHPGCTARDADAYYSFRRDGTTGRFASLIWLA